MISLIAVDPMEQGKGIGKALMELALEEGRQRDVRVDLRVQVKKTVRCVGSLSRHTRSRLSRKGRKM